MSIYLSNSENMINLTNGSYQNKHHLLTYIYKNISVVLPLPYRAGLSFVEAK